MAIFDTSGPYVRELSPDEKVAFRKKEIERGKRRAEKERRDDEKQIWLAAAPPHCRGLIRKSRIVTAIIFTFVGFSLAVELLR